MSLNIFKTHAVRHSIAQAFALKKRGHYAAAKSIIRHHLDKHPHHHELHTLYRRIEKLQQERSPDDIN